MNLFLFSNRGAIWATVDPRSREISDMSSHDVCYLSAICSLICFSFLRCGVLEFLIESLLGESKAFFATKFDFQSTLFQFELL